MGSGFRGPGSGFRVPRADHVQRGVPRLAEPGTRTPESGTSPIPSGRTQHPFRLRRLPVPRPRMPHTDAVVVLTTVATSDEAVQLVRSLLERRIIACGTILPGSRSLYRWEGKIADESEVVVLLKTRSARIESLEMAFAELHPYKVPELLALPVNAGTRKYLAWISGETTLALT